MALTRPTLNRRQALTTLAGAGALMRAKAAPSPSPPNIVIINCDDMGWGDIHSFGSPIATPFLDRMCQEGTRFTNAISANPVCSPSRAALLTGRYPTRVGVPHVLLVPDHGGLSKDETTLAELLKQKDYATACLGKWHIGHQPDQLPTKRGFDSYYGIPYSNDMKPAVVLDNESVAEPEANQDTLTARYTGRALRFIDQNQRKPFFLYLAHSFPHIPLHVNDRFRGKSPIGLYGDVVNELDWSTGQVLDKLRSTGLAKNTLVVFTSDNGPWYQGSPGLSRGRKGATWEGGVRIPFIAWQPGTVPAGRTCKAFVSQMDLFPAIANQLRLKPPKPTDGIDIGPLLTGKVNNIEREPILYFNDVHLQCIRKGNWKLHMARYNGWMYEGPVMMSLKNLPLPKPELYDVGVDLDESYDLSDRHPEIVKDLLARVDAMLPTFPEAVQKDWVKTRELKVLPTPAGAYPMEVGSFRMPTSAIVP
jgi:arylsulfatase A